MKKIEKTTTIPKSLNSNLTNKRRLEIINNKKFPNRKTIREFSSKNIKTYTDRYKTKDIRESLKQDFNYKCAFCEQRVERFDVEHYRPKSIYYWLAYSWDNLLYCCPVCNQNKSNSFPTKNKIVEFDFKNISKIHNIRDKYDEIEEPLLINPENKTDYSEIICNKNGEFYTNNKQLNETIILLKLNREFLLINRKLIYEKLEKSITEKIYEIKNGNNNAKIKLQFIVNDFIKETKKESTEFTLFRKFVIKNLLLNLIN